MKLLTDLALFVFYTILFFCVISLGFKLGDYGNDPLISPTDKMIMEIKGGGKRVNPQHGNSPSMLKPKSN